MNDFINMTDAYEYCDSCGDGIDEGDGIGVEAFLEDVEWKGQGESGVLCQACIKVIAFTPSIPDNEEGSPHIGELP